MTASMWEYSDQEDWASRRLIGYKVEATDGGIGKVDDATMETGAQSLVVDTGPWIFGQKVMVPAGMIDRVDHTEETVYVSVDKDRVKNSPEYSDDTSRSTDYRQRLGDYYGGLRGDH